MIEVYVATSERSIDNHSIISVKEDSLIKDENVKLTVCKHNVNNGAINGEHSSIGMEGEGTDTRKISAVRRPFPNGLVRYSNYTV